MQNNATRPPFCAATTRRGGDSNPRQLRPSPPPFAGGVTCPPQATVCRLCAAVRVRAGTAGAGGVVLRVRSVRPGCRAAMSEKGELDLTGVKQNTGMWLVKVSGRRALAALSRAAFGAVGPAGLCAAAS